MIIKLNWHHVVLCKLKPISLNSSCLAAFQSHRLLLHSSLVDQRDTMAAKILVSLSESDTYELLDTSS